MFQFENQHNITLQNRQFCILAIPLQTNGKHGKNCVYAAARIIVGIGNANINHIQDGSLPRKQRKE